VSEKLKNLKLNLLLKELKLLDSEKDYIDEFTTHYSPVFMEELSNNGYIAQTPTGETNNHNIKNSQKNIIDVNDDDKKLIKNIFRTIAKASHPDKTPNQYKNKLYDEAQIAYDENNLLVLYKIAKKLNIEIEININTLTLLEKIVEDKKKQLKSVETSFLWLWANAETQEKKDQLINQFLNKHNKK
jgi:hypothetical protein